MPGPGEYKTDVGGMGSLAHHPSSSSTFGARTTTPAGCAVPGPGAYEQVRFYRDRPVTWDTGGYGARVGLGYRCTVYKRTLPPAASRGWFGFIINSKGFVKFKAKVLTGFIKPQTQVALGFKNR